jgi:hypothetical protein
VDAHAFVREAEKVETTLSARKLMVTVFWDRKGVLMVEFMQERTTVTSKLYFEIRKKLRRADHSEKMAWNADIRCSAPP